MNDIIYDFIRTECALAAKEAVDDYHNEVIDKVRDSIFFSLTEQRVCHVPDYTKELYSMLVR